MPFKKKTSAKASPLQRDTRKIFVGRADEIRFFRENILQPEEPAHNILAISGPGGVGKSTLLLRFIGEAQATDFKDYCLTALVDEHQTTPVHIMEKLAQQLGLAGAFEKALTKYHEILRNL